MRFSDARPTLINKIIARYLEYQSLQDNNIIIIIIYVNRQVGNTFGTIFIRRHCV